jgi:hypothetical protein
MRNDSIKIKIKTPEGIIERVPKIIRFGKNEKLVVTYNHKKHVVEKFQDGYCLGPETRDIFKKFPKPVLDSISPLLSSF